MEIQKLPILKLKKSFLKNNNRNITTNNDEHEPLINDIENSIDKTPDNPLSRQLDSLDSLNVNIKNISYTLNSYINEAQNSRQLKLQSIELYELNYIINYML